jgi:rare lipoprotein A
MTAVGATTRPSKKPEIINNGQISQRSSSSLPVITPLQVTELETDVAVPKIVAAVPTATSEIGFIPSVEPQSPQFIATNKLANTRVNPTTSEQSRMRQVPPVAKLPKLNLPPVAQSPQVLAAKPIGFQPGKSIVKLQPLDRQLRSVGQISSSKISQAPQSPQFVPTQTPIVFQNQSPAIANPPQFQTIPELSAVTLSPASSPKTVARRVLAHTKAPRLLTVGRNDRPQAIVNTATAEAEGRIIAQAAPSPSMVTEIPEVPSFEFGTPVFIFSQESPRQIVATAIAQVGNTGELAAPETSISIPVAPPKKSGIPDQSSRIEPQQVIPVTPLPVEPVTPATERIVATQTGQASWYGLEAGPKTANGERYNPRALTAAHRSLPFGTRVRVTNLKSGKSVTVRINDRGPFTRGRIIDMSESAAEAIGIKRSGVGQVRVEILEAAKPAMYN